MGYSFNCYGHENITCKHKTTLEFTKDSELSLKGDCIVGVKADFSIKEVKRFIESLGNNKKITITIETLDYNNKEYDNRDSKKIKNNENNNKIINNNITIEKNKIKNNKNETKNEDKKFIEKINCEINPDFNSDKEMVIRKGDFISERTFAIKADKAAFGLDKGLIGLLRSKGGKITVTVERGF